jgi:hypothetical protein
MDAIRISKPNMSALRQSPAALSPFGMLAQAFAEELLARLTPVEGAYDRAPTELLEEAGPQPAESSGRRDLQVDVRLILELMQKQQLTKERESEKRILEKAAKISLAQKPEAAVKTEALPGRIRQNFYQSIHQHIQINPLLRQTEGGRLPESESAVSAQARDGLKTGRESQPGLVPSAGLQSRAALPGRQGAEERSSDSGREILPQPELNFPEPDGSGRSDTAGSVLRAAAQAAERAVSELGALAAAEAKRKNEPAKEIRSQRGDMAQPGPAEAAARPETARAWHADAGAGTEKGLSRASSAPEAKELPGDSSVPAAREKSPEQAAAELQEKISRALDRELRNQPTLRTARDIRVGGSGNQIVPGAAPAIQEAEKKPEAEAEREAGLPNLSYREENREPEAASVQTQTQPKSGRTENAAGSRTGNEQKKDSADGKAAKPEAAAQKSGTDGKAVKSEAAAQKSGADGKTAKPAAAAQKNSAEPGAAFAAAGSAESGALKPGPEPKGERPESPRTKPAEKPDMRAARDIRVGSGMTAAGGAQPVLQQRPGEQEESGNPAAQTIFSQESELTYRAETQTPGAEAVPAAAQRQPGKAAAAHAKTEAALPPASAGAPAEPIASEKTGAPARRPLHETKSAESAIPRGTQSAVAPAARIEMTPARPSTIREKERAEEQPMSPGQPMSSGQPMSPGQPLLRAARDIRMGRTPREPDAAEKQSGAERKVAEENISALSGAEELSYREENRGADAETHRPDGSSGTQAAIPLARQTERHAAAREAAAAAAAAREGRGGIRLC